MGKEEWTKENRVSWNAATRRHNSHKGDQAAFLREGGSTLYPEEIELLDDIKGQTLLHLQCNAGQDTLSIASQLGAVVTGVDLSDEAISFAKQLVQDSGIPGTFYCADVFDWLERNEQEYDVVFVSYGAVMWLTDLEAWGKGIAKALKPGGRFVLVEFHPMMCILDGALSGDWQEACDYLGGKHYGYELGVGDYVAEAGGALIPGGEPAVTEELWQNPNPSHEYSWGVADVVSALLEAGLTLTTLREYPYSNGFNPFPNMVELPGRKMTFAEDMPLIPLMFAVCARK